MKLMLRAVLLFFVSNVCGLIAQAQTPNANNILYVNINATGTGTGTTWADAIPQLADALKWARTKYNTNNAVFDTNPLKIYVAKGTYKPLYSALDGQFTTDGGRDNAFVMVKNVQLYGGFDPANDVIKLNDNRIFGLAGSILSGDVNGNDVISGAAATLSITGNSENNYHVAVLAGDVGTVELNGFTITGGNANVSSDATINGQTLSRFAGGALNAISSAPKVNRCMIVGNYAKYGGGISTNTASPNIVNCIITKNLAEIGGGMYSGLLSPSKLLNCAIIENKATHSSIGGGGMNAFSSPSPPILTNVTIANNGTLGASFTTTTPVIQNSVIWDVVNGSYTASYSLIKGSSTTADNNINAGGLTETNVFNNYLAGDYRLKATSPAVNKGSSSLYRNNGGNLTQDVDVHGNIRLFSTAIDVGAYENPSIEISSGNILYVNVNATGDGTGGSWTNAITQLAVALKWAKQQTTYAFTAANPLKIYIAKGTYKPMYIPKDGADFADVGRSNAFLMVKDVQLYGGFDPANGITDLTKARIYGDNGTILSGDIGVSGVNTDNNYHVLVASGNVGAAKLDGLTITAGYANGGVRSNIVAGNTIVDGHGAGIYHASASPIYQNIIIKNNYAEWDGAGVYNTASSPILTNMLFTGNYAYYRGAAIANFSSSSPVLANNPEIVNRLSNKIVASYLNMSPETLSRLKSRK